MKKISKILALILLPTISFASVSVTTFAGGAEGGTLGYNRVDGEGLNADFDDPTDIIRDLESGYLVSEYQAIRKIDESGNVSTLFTKEYFTPYQIAIDSEGNIYASGDQFFTENYGYHDQLVYKFDRSGTILQTWGNVNTLGAENDIDPSNGIVVTPWGDVLASDYSNNKIYKLNADGTSQEYLSSSEIELSYPMGMSVGDDGEVYLVSNGDFVSKIGQDGSLSLVYGKLTNENGARDVYVDYKGVAYIVAAGKIFRLDDKEKASFISGKANNNKTSISPREIGASVVDGYYVNWYSITGITKSSDGNLLTTGYHGVVSKVDISTNSNPTFSSFDKEESVYYYYLYGYDSDGYIRKFECDIVGSKGEFHKEETSSYGYLNSPYYDEFGTQKFSISKSEIGEISSYACKLYDNQGGLLSVSDTFDMLTLVTPTPEPTPTPTAPSTITPTPTTTYSMTPTPTPTPTDYTTPEPTPMLPINPTQTPMPTATPDVYCYAMNDGTYYNCDGFSEAIAVPENCIYKDGYLSNPKTGLYCKDNAYSIVLPVGWSLNGVSFDIDNLAEFFNANCVKWVWNYKNSQWYNYTPNGINRDFTLKAHDGFWIKTTSECSLNYTRE